MILSDLNSSSSVDMEHDYYTEKWKSKGFNIEQAKEWIKIGLKRDDYGIAEEWKKRGSSSKQVEKWVKLGLQLQEVEFIDYLKRKKYNSDQTPEQLIAEFHVWQKNPPAQEYLNRLHYKEKRKGMKVLNFGFYREDSEGVKLKGDLDLSDFADLEKLNCPDNNLTSLDLANCSQLKQIKCNCNRLNNLVFPLFSSEQLFELEFKRQ